MKLRPVVTATALFFLGLHGAQALTLVPEGNRNAEQPGIPAASAKRTKATKSSFDAKYAKVLNLLQNDTRLRSKIKQISAQYGISPLHMAGAIVGEHTYNVDAYDRLQTYYVKALAYVASDITFEANGEKVADFVDRPQFEACKSLKGSEALWTCRERVWNSAFRGKTVDGIDFPNNRFSAVFFQPFYAGQTFGIGQLNPLTALQMSDRVNQVSGLPRLDVNNANEVYRTIMDPDLTLPYMAATIRNAIDAYKKIADVDISENPGITATLYNTGDPETRAAALAGENEKRRQAGEPEKLPEENYYGWLINDRLNDLKALF
ncbi:MAG: DUF1402 family protein [Rhizobiaceae bacterium]